MHGHQSAIRTFLDIAETHDPISMRSQVQYWAGEVSQDQTRHFAYNKRIGQKPYPFLLSYLEDSGPPHLAGETKNPGAACFQAGLPEPPGVHEWRQGYRTAER
jgi:hypothetical protein